MRNLCLGILICFTVAGCAHQHGNAVAVNRAQTAPLMERGSAAYERGQFEESIAAWDQALNQYAAAGDTAGEIDARTALAAARMMIGRYDLAVESLRPCVARAREIGDVEREIKALNALAVAYTFSPRAGERPQGGAHDHSEHSDHSAHAHHAATAPATQAATDSHDPQILLAAAIQLAKNLGNVPQQASAWNNLGNYFARSADYAQAMQAYSKAAELSASSDKLLTCKATVNRAVAALTAYEAQGDDAKKPPLRDQAIQANQAGRNLLDQLPNSHERAFLLITTGQTAEQLARLDPAIAKEQRALARKSYEQANIVADALGDLRSRSYACGYLGGMHLEDKELDRAEELTRRAIMAAQQARLPDSLYRWQWQNARLHRARWEATKDDKSLDASIRYYAAATQPVQFIRNDISLGHGNARKKVSFRESIGSLYFEYADMLLRRAEQCSNDKAMDDLKRSREVAALYIEARSTVEQLKAVELENYFQDECVHLLKSKQKSVQDLDGATAVIYMIPLADRTEILVSFKGQEFFRASSKLTGSKLKQVSELLRSQISDVDQAGEFDPYRTTGGFLYKQLIAPIRPELDRRQIKTLVFVPDGPLRMIPMGVLYDGQRHLVEDFAIAITPGLELLEPRSIERSNVQLLTSGLSQEREVNGLKFKALSYVPTELKAIQSYYKNGTNLEDENFVQTKLEQAMEKRPYSIVHVASHAVFGDTASESFLLTYDKTMQLDDIERLIRPYQLRDQPVELLTLSACQSAKGDKDQERAALGLAGIAVKAGARSAVASLWSVDEQASMQLMQDFYAELSKGGASGDLKSQISKAQAMRDAQVKMLHDQRFNHPYYWGAFLVIGNWL